MDQTEKIEFDSSAILGQVIEFCHINLNNDTAVSKYVFNTRKINLDSVNKFKLGAFPSNIYTILKQFDNWDLQKAGIISHINGKPYSKFCYNQMIIPIYDPYGLPLAIIGRTLLDEEARKRMHINKYDNTRFAKNSSLFGLNLAIDEIRNNDEAIVVEGNLDVISAHQYGHRNVVGLSSLGFTKNQASLISRYTKNVYIMLDNDEPGKKATNHMLSKPSFSGISINAKSFPDIFKDPDEYYKSLGS